MGLDQKRKKLGVLSRMGLWNCGSIPVLGWSRTGSPSELNRLEPVPPWHRENATDSPTEPNRDCLTEPLPYLFARLSFFDEYTSCVIDRFGI